MEPLPHPFLSSVKGKLGTVLESSNGAKWLPPLQAAIRQLNISEEEEQKVLIDIKKYAEKVGEDNLRAIAPDRVVPFLLNSIWSSHVRSSKSDSEQDSSSKTGADVVAGESEGFYEDVEETGEEEDEELEGDGMTDNAKTKSTSEDAADREPANQNKRYKLLLENVAPFYIDKWHQDLPSDKNINPLGKKQKRFSRSLWRHIMNNMEPEYRLPTLILKKHQYVKREEPKNLGPGCYDPHYYESLRKKRLGLTRGLMYSCAPRFAREFVKMDSPDPGAYGNPYDRLKRKSFGKVSLLQSGPCDLRGATFKLKGSALGPGDYEAKSSIEQVINKRVSRRGPYELFTQKDRFEFIHGFFKRPKLNLEPGMYGVHGNMIQRMNNRYNVLKGRLSKVNRDAKCTGERITISNPMWPSAEAEKFPGPGTYDLKEPKYHFTCWGENYWAFNVSTEARQKETSDYDSAPTRYRPELAFTKYCATGSGFRSNFISKSGRLDPTKAMVLSERLRAKDIPPTEKRTKLGLDCS